uniref:Uncharacterized protein n=1 Tax=Dulem virus 235 TaxID=3145712 RepID=A0AAU8AYN0_9VIRU
MDIRLFNQCCRESDDSVYMGHRESRGVFNPDEVSALYPVNPVYGYPESDTAKIMDINLSVSERESIVSRLQRMDSQYFPNGLSDDDILSLVPPRYFTDAVDVQSWRDYLSAYVLPDMSDNALDKVQQVVEPSGSESGNDSNNSNNNNE